MQVADLQLAAAVPALLLVDDQGLTLLLDDQVVARLVVLRERLLLVLELEDRGRVLGEVDVVHLVDAVVAVVGDDRLA